MVLFQSSAVWRVAARPASGVLAGWCGAALNENLAPKVASRTGSAAASRILQNRSVTFTTSGGNSSGRPFSLARPVRGFSSSSNAPPPPTTTTTTVAPKVSSSSSPGFLQWYEGHLQARPVLTKMITGSLLWGIGDAVAQVVPQLSSSASNDPAAVLVPYDYPRTARAAFFGFAIHAPTSHVHFNFLEWMTNRLGVTGLYIPVFKAFMEQFVYWSWLSNSLYHGAMGAMQGMSMQQIYDRIADVLWETQKAQWVFWIPVQLLNFQFVPVRHQLNVVLLTSIVWTALLSMWYPPEQPDAVEKVDISDEQ